MAARRQNKKDLAYIKKFTYPSVGEFEIHYNREHKYFQTYVNEEFVTGPSEHECEARAREYLERTTKLDWKPFIIIDKSKIGSTTADDYYTYRGALRRSCSFELCFWRIEVAVTTEKRRPRIERKHVEDKKAEEYWTEDDERRWNSGSAATMHHENEDCIYLDYDPVIWDTLMRMCQAMEHQRDNLKKLWGSKNLEKQLLAQRSTLPALPAPKRRRRA
jgi:hypothetical protein